MPHSLGRRLFKNWKGSRLDDLYYREVGTLNKTTYSYNNSGEQVGSVSETVFVMSCWRCGALVHRVDAHNRWHAEVEV